MVKNSFIYKVLKQNFIDKLLKQNYNKNLLYNTDDIVARYLWRTIVESVVLLGQFDTNNKSLF